MTAGVRRYRLLGHTFVPYRGTVCPDFIGDTDEKSKSNVVDSHLGYWRGGH